MSVARLTRSSQLRVFLVAIPGNHAYKCIFVREWLHEQSVEMVVQSGNPPGIS